MTCPYSAVVESWFELVWDGLGWFGRGGEGRTSCEVCNDVI